MDNKYGRLFRIILLDLLLLSIITIGIDLRTRHTHKYMAINTACFFYERANYLYEKGGYPKVDMTSLAPVARPENYPPGLAYATVAAYYFTNALQRYSFYEFAVVFPVIMYILIFFLGYYFIASLYSRSAGIIFASLFTVMPAACKLTSPCYFTSESVGVFFYLLSIFLVIKIDKKPLPYTILSVISMTFFVLTYQLFIPFLVLIAIIAAIRYKHRGIVLAYLSVLLLPLLIGHIIARYLIGIDYSPLYVFRELLIGIIEGNSEHYRVAMRRTKLNPMDIKGYIDNFTWVSIPLLFAGMAACAKKITHLLPLLGCIIGIFLACHYIKFRFIALPFILIVSAIGWEFLSALARRIDKRKENKH